MPNGDPLGNIGLSEKEEKKLRKDSSKTIQRLRKEAEKIKDLPNTKEKQERIQTLRAAAFKVRDNIRKRAIAGATGKLPEEPSPEERQSALNFAIESLQKPTSGVSKITQSLINEPGESRKENVEEFKGGLFDIIPFSETVTGQESEKELFESALDEAGFAEGTRISEVFPSAFSKRGEGLPLKEGGIFDLSDRDIAGLALDLTLDPLNFVAGPIVKGTAKTAQAASRGVAKSTTGLSSMREVAARIPAVRKMARTVNNNAFLSPDQHQSEALDGMLKQLAADKNAMSDEALRTFEETVDAAHLSDKEVQRAARNVDDITRLVEDGDIAEINRRFEGLGDVLKENQILGDPEAIRATFLYNSNLSARQKEGVEQIIELNKKIGRMEAQVKKLQAQGADEAISKFNKAGGQKVSKKNLRKLIRTQRGLQQGKLAKGPLTPPQESLTSTQRSAVKKLLGKRNARSKKLSKQQRQALKLNKEEQKAAKELFHIEELNRINEGFLPNYVPRPIIDDSSIAMRHQEWEDVPQVAKEEYRDKMVGRKTAQAMTGEADDMTISDIVGGGATINKRLRDYPRIFRTHAEAAEAAKLKGAQLESDLSTLMGRKFRKAQKEGAVSRILDQAGDMIDPAQIPDSQKVKVGGKTLPKDFVDSTRRLIKRNDIDEMQGFNKVWKKWMLNPFKKSVTFPHPGYHIRNIIDDSFRNWEEFGVKSLNPKKTKEAAHVLSDSDKLIPIGANGLQIHANELFKEFWNRGVFKHKLPRADVASSSKEIINQLKSQKSRIRSILRGPVENLPVSEEFATKVNNHARAKAGLLAMEDEANRLGITSLSNPADREKLFNQALKRSNRALIDISDLGPLDDALANFIPFYRFFRKNIPFQLRTLTKNPQRISKLAFAENQFQAQELEDKEKRALAPYIRDNFLFSLGDDTSGNHIIANKTGLSIEDINRLWGSEDWADAVRKITVSQSAPPLKALYGFISNKHPFFGSDLEDVRRRKVYGILKDKPIVEELVGGITEVQDGVDSNGDPVTTYSLDNPKQYFMVTTLLTPLMASGIQRSVGGSFGTLLSGFASERGVQTLGKLTDEQKKMTTKLINTLSPTAIRKRDITEAQLEQMIEAYDEANEELQTEKSRLRDKIRALRLAAEAEEEQQQETTQEPSDADIFQEALPLNDRQQGGNRP